MHHSSIDVLHSWLLGATSFGAPYVLIDTGAPPLDACSAKVVELLNEFDDAEDARWIHLDAAMIRAVATSMEHRRLLGIDDAEADCQPTSTRGIRLVLNAFARRGHFVVNHPEATRALADNPRGFRAAIRRPTADIEDFHLILNPSRFSPHCLASLVADSYLEWVASASPA